MNALSLLRATEYIGAKELRLRLDEILREPQHPYRVMLRNKPAFAIIPDQQFLELLELLEELKDSGVLASAARKLKRESKKKHAWFWAEEWQKGERQADADVRAGRVKKSGSAAALAKQLGA